MAASRLAITLSLSAGARDPIPAARVKSTLARVLPIGDRAGCTLQGFAAEQVAPGATLITDEASGYEGMPFDHASISARRFSNRSLRAKAASTLFLTACASAASMTACGVWVCSAASSRKLDRFSVKPCSRMGHRRAYEGALMLVNNVG